MPELSNRDCAEAGAAGVSTRSFLHRSVPAHLADRMSCSDATGSHGEDRWFAVWSIAFGSFAMVFSEIIPIGLLSHVSSDLAVSIGLAGLMVVVPAVTAAVAAPLLTLGSSRIERRMLMRILSVLLLVSNVLAAIAPDFGVMLVARAVLGLCIGGFWVFGAGAAISLVRSEQRGRTIAIVSGGIFVATVAALPIAALIGTLTTWRVAFVIAAALSVAAFAVQLVALPCLGAGANVHRRTLLTVLELPLPRLGLLAASAIFFANFAAYTYLNPLLQHRAGLTADQVTLVLLGFGVAGGISNFTAGRTVRHRLRATMFAAGALVFTGTLLISLTSGEPIVTVVFVFVWGAGFGAVPVAAQTWMAQTMPQAVEGGLALFVSALQGSLAAGSAVGGVLYNTYGPVGPLVAAVVAAGLGSCAVSGRRAAVDRPDVIAATFVSLDQGAPARSVDSVQAQERKAT
jgi:predicted MFS family arabinose efflux permease